MGHGCFMNLPDPQIDEISDPSLEEKFREIGLMEDEVRRYFKELRELRSSEEEENIEIRIGLRSTRLHAQLARNW